MVRNSPSWPSSQVAPSSARASTEVDVGTQPTGGGIFRRSKPPTAVSSNPNKLLKLLRKISSHNAIAEIKGDVPASPSSARFPSFVSLSGSFSDIRRWKRRSGKHSSAGSECSDLDSPWASQPPTPSGRDMASQLHDLRATYLSRNAVSHAGSETASYTSSCSYSPYIPRLGGSTSGGSAASSEIAVVLDSSFSSPPHPICGVVSSVNELHHTMRGMLESIPNSQQHRSALDSLVAAAAGEVSRFDERMAAVENLERRVRQQRLEKQWRFVQTREQLASSMYHLLKMIIKYSFGLQQSDVRTLEMVDVLCQWEEGLKCKSASAEGEPWQLDALDYVLELLNTQTITLVQIEREVLDKETSETRAFIAHLEGMLRNNPQQLLAKCSMDSSSRSSEEGSSSGKMKKSPSKVRFQDIDEPKPSMLKNVLKPLKFGSNCDDGASGSGSGSGSPSSPAAPAPCVLGKPSPALKSALKGGSKSYPVPQTFQLDVPLDPCPALSSMTSMHESDSEPDLLSIRHTQSGHSPRVQITRAAAVNDDGPHQCVDANQFVGPDEIVNQDEIVSQENVRKLADGSVLSFSTYYTADSASLSSDEYHRTSSIASKLSSDEIHADGSSNESLTHRSSLAGEASSLEEVDTSVSSMQNAPPSSSAFDGASSEPPSSAVHNASAQPSSSGFDNMTVSPAVLAGTHITNTHAAACPMTSPTCQTAEISSLNDSSNTLEVPESSSGVPEAFQPSSSQAYALPPSGRPGPIAMEPASTSTSIASAPSSRGSIIPPAIRPSPRPSLDTPRGLPPTPVMALSSLHHAMYTSPRKLAPRGYPTADIPPLSHVPQEEANPHLLHSSRSDLSSCPSARSRDSLYSHGTSNSIPDAPDGAQFLDVWYSNGFFDVPASPGTHSTKSSVAARSDMVPRDGPIMVSQADSTDGTGSSPLDTHRTGDSYNRLPMPPMSVLMKSVRG